MLISPCALAAQSNVLDLRVAEFNDAGDITYQNFIYARSLRDGRYVLQALYLRLPQAKYNEVALGAGVRVAKVHTADVYAVAGFGSATDANYWEPAVLAQDVTGRFTGLLFVQRYTPVNDEGVVQWLVDPIDAQYTIKGRLALGASFYAYRPDGGDWLTKIGPKLSVSDKRGSTEIRVARVNQNGGTEIQLRRIVVF